MPARVLLLAPLLLGASLASAQPLPGTAPSDRNDDGGRKIRSVSSPFTGEAPAPAKTTHGGDNAGSKAGERFYVGGRYRTCSSINDLDVALRTESGAFFYDWSDYDFGSAESWARKCVSDGGPYTAQNRVDGLRNMQRKLREQYRAIHWREIEAKAAVVETGPTGIRASCKSLERFAANAGQDVAADFGKPQEQWTRSDLKLMKDRLKDCVSILYLDQRRADEIRAGLAALVQRMEEQAAQRELAALAGAKATAPLAALEQCQAGRAWQLYDMQENLIGDQDSLAGWQNILAQEKRINQMAGDYNGSAKTRNAARWIVQIESDIAVHWERYRQLGGKAKSPASVTHALANPCPAG